MVHRYFALSMYQAMSRVIDLYGQGVDALKKLKAAAEELAERLELPGEVLLGSSKVTVTAEHRALIENHRGIVEYGTELMTVQLTRGRLVISGSALTIEAMNKTELLICGKIQAIEWE